MPNEEIVFYRLLDDAELRLHLEAKQTIRFEGLGNKAGIIQGQVNRLGYGDAYKVLFTKEPPGDWTRLTPKPGDKVNPNPSKDLSKPNLAERLPSKLGLKNQPKKYAP